MLKNISNLGSVLNKSEQKNINGGSSNCTPYKCWLRYGSPWMTPDDFFCNGPICGIGAE